MTIASISSRGSPALIVDPLDSPVARGLPPTLFIAADLFPAADVSLGAELPLALKSAALNVQRMMRASFPR